MTFAPGAADAEERARLWAMVADHTGYGDVDGYARRRSSETAVVVLEPRADVHRAGRPASEAAA